VSYVFSLSVQKCNSFHSLVSDDITHLRGSVTLCEHNKDFVSRDLLSKMLDDEEQHLDWLDTQIALIGKISLENYLQAPLLTWTALRVFVDIIYDL